MTEKTRILINDRATYFKRLLDAKILITALKSLEVDVDDPTTLHPSLVIERKVSHTGVEYDVTVTDRLKELDVEYKILEARVHAYEEELNKTIEGKEELALWENGGKPEIPEYGGTVEV